MLIEHMFKWQFVTVFFFFFGIGFQVRSSKFSLYLCVYEGSLVLVGGDPGVGKSTLLLQVCIFCKTFYVL